MEALNSRNQFNILAKRIFPAPVASIEPIVSVRIVFSKFNFRNESGLLQFWECSSDMGGNVMLTDHTYMISTRDNKEVEDYRRICLEKQYPFVGLETNVGNWLAGRAAQTEIADHRTKHFVLNQEDQHSADVGGMGQLVLPVYKYYYDQGTAGNKLVGIIEFVTPVPKESYVEYFEQIHKLMKGEGIASTFMGKTIKVEYLNDIIRFTLPLSAELTDLLGNVTERLPELKDQNICIGYKDTKGSHVQISSDADLRVCIEESSSKGEKFIKMFAFV